MGQFSMEISGCAGSALSGNQQLVNDTYFPAVWASAKYTYDITVREGA